MRAQTEMRMRAYCTGCGELFTVSAIIGSVDEQHDVLVLGKIRQALRDAVCKACYKQMSRLDYFEEHPRKAEFDKLQSQLALCVEALEFVVAQNRGGPVEYQARAALAKLGEKDL